MTALRVSAATDAEVAGDIAHGHRVPADLPGGRGIRGTGATWSPFTAVRAGRSEPSNVSSTMSADC